ncbi:hypothetical protein DFH06DRAFT_691254 [Mycena polygramma]|nr:hypothetical protein DFH06DRAFT_691254 [Mycena polygramma]
MAVSPGARPVAYRHTYRHRLPMFAILFFVCLVLKAHSNLFPSSDAAARGQSGLRRPGRASCTFRPHEISVHVGDPDTLSLSTPRVTLQEYRGVPHAQGKKDRDTAPDNNPEAKGSGVRARHGTLGDGLDTDGCLRWRGQIEGANEGKLGT